MALGTLLVSAVTCVALVGVLLYLPMRWAGLFDN